MRKYICLLIVSLVLWSCTGTSQSEYDKSVNQKNKLFRENKDTEQHNKTFIYNNDTVIYEFVNGKYAKIISTKRFVEDADLQIAVDSLDVKEKTVYFYTKGLSDSGEDYAFKMGDVITIDKDMPTTKRGIAIRKKKGSIETQLDAAQMFLKDGIKVDDINAVLNTLSMISADFFEMKKYENKESEKQIQVIKNKISQMQVKVYPALRKAFAQNAKSKLWEEDIKVVQNGTTITFIGHQFVTNRNIKESYEAIYEYLISVRYKKAIFKWHDYSEYTYYNIDSPKDSDVK
ncbi:MAG: hypothetical protein E6772_16655 [Dysgonomonas sp.]|nr:hypothetical protein [Dysgonomonas sp.]